MKRVVYWLARFPWGVWRLPFGTQDEAMEFLRTVMTDDELTRMYGIERE